MRALVQRVSSASVEVEGKTVGSIGRGLLLFVGFGRQDVPASLAAAVNKLLELRVFSDERGKMNLSLKDVHGGVLIVSQFTLYANCGRGRRPDFTSAASPPHAERLYDEFVRLFKQSGIEVQTGVFAADMKVSLLNDGPVTLMLEF
ncbi:MAG: D-aminoacyl-tRNA deacylase [Candidatus Syntrophosphaera sp.]